MSSAIDCAHSQLARLEQAQNFQQQLFDAMRQECMVHPTSNAVGVPASEYCTQDYEWQPPPSYGFYDAARVSHIAKGRSARPLTVLSFMRQVAAVLRNDGTASLFTRSKTRSYHQTILRPKGDHDRTRGNNPTAALDSASQESTLGSMMFPRDSFWGITGALALVATVFHRIGYMQGVSAAQSEMRRRR
eukprot:SAG31_NODE_5983_length_2227_cov_1.446898_2_plen_189_part_00